MPQVDDALAKRLLDHHDGRLPGPDECAALHAFLHGLEPSCEDFVSCYEWCLQHGYPDVVTSIQSAYPAFSAFADTTHMHPRDVATYIDTLTSHRIACGLRLRVSDPAMSLHLARCLASPQCAISELALVLPAWTRLTGGSLLAGLGSAIAECPSIGHLTLFGPEQGRCELETSLIVQSIANAHLLNLRLGTGLSWHDGAWPELEIRVLDQMLKRNDRSMSLQMANAYANAIALNGVSSGSYLVELGLSASWRSKRAQELETAPYAKKGEVYWDGGNSLKYVAYGPVKK